MSMVIRKVEAPDAEHLIRVQWEDGSESHYPCVWLRDNCQCPQCFLHSAKARKLLFEDLDVDTVAKEITLTHRKKFSIAWPDERMSEYEAEWLKKRCFSEGVSWFGGLKTESCGAVLWIMEQMFTSSRVELQSPW